MTTPIKNNKNNKTGITKKPLTITKKQALKMKNDAQWVIKPEWIIIAGLGLLVFFIISLIAR